MSWDQNRNPLPLLYFMISAHPMESLRFVLKVGEDNRNGRRMYSHFLEWPFYCPVFVAFLDQAHSAESFFKRLYRKDRTDRSPENFDLPIEELNFIEELSSCDIKIAASLNRTLSEAGFICLRETSPSNRISQMRDWAVFESLEQPSTKRTR